MAKVEFIRHKDKDILFIDFSHSDSEQILSVIDEAKKIIAGQPRNSLLTLTDVTGAKYNNDVRDALKAFVNHNSPYVKARAVTGVSGLMMVLYNAVKQFTGTNIPIFPSLDEARDWLVEQ
jgi:hypothetical protein